MKYKQILLTMLLFLNTGIVQAQENSNPTSESYEVIVGIGDSNLQGLSDTNTHAQDNYDIPLPELIGEALDANQIENNGIAGSTIATNPETPTYEPMNERVNHISNNGDLVLLQGGINDWIKGVPLGELGDTNPDTFYGALEQYYGNAKERFEYADLLALTITDTTWSRQVSDGVTLQQWADAQIEVANKHQIPIYDLLRESGFNAREMSQDGLHYNQETAKELADFIVTKMKQDDRFKVGQQPSSEENKHENTDNLIEQTTETIQVVNQDNPLKEDTSVEVPSNEVLSIHNEIRTSTANETVQEAVELKKPEKLVETGETSIVGIWTFSLVFSTIGLLLISKKTL